jgi:hypothetical protein
MLHDSYDVLVLDFLLDFDYATLKQGQENTHIEAIDFTVRVISLDEATFIERGHESTELYESTPVDEHTQMFGLCHFSSPRK